MRWFPLFIQRAGRSATRVWFGVPGDGVFALGCEWNRLRDVSLPCLTTALRRRLPSTAPAPAFCLMATAFPGAAAAFWMAAIKEPKEKGAEASKKAATAWRKAAAATQEAAAGGRKAATAWQKAASGGRKAAAGVQEAVAACLKAAAAGQENAAGARQGVFFRPAEPVAKPRILANAPTPRRVGSFARTRGSGSFATGSAANSHSRLLAAKPQTTEGGHALE